MLMPELRHCNQHHLDYCTLSQLYCVDALSRSILSHAWHVSQLLDFEHSVGFKPDLLYMSSFV